MEIASSDEIRDDRLGGPLGDADFNRDLSGPNGGIAVNANEHMGVVAQKGPRPFAITVSLSSVHHLPSRSNVRRPSPGHWR